MHTVPSVRAILLVGCVLFVLCRPPGKPLWPNFLLCQLETSEGSQEKNEFPFYGQMRYPFLGKDTFPQEWLGALSTPWFRALALSQWCFRDLEVSGVLLFIFFGNRLFCTGSIHFLDSRRG